MATATANRLDLDLHQKADRIRQLCRARFKGDHHDMAARVGVEAAYLRDVMRGKQLPRDILDSVLARLGQYHGVSSHWLKTGEGSMFTHRPAEANGEVDVQARIAPEPTTARESTDEPPSNGHAAAIADPLGILAALDRQLRDVLGRLEALESLEMIGGLEDRLAALEKVAGDRPGGDGGAALVGRLEALERDCRGGRNLAEQAAGVAERAAEQAGKALGRLDGLDLPMLRALPEQAREATARLDGLESRVDGLEAAVVALDARPAAEARAPFAAALDPRRLMAWLDYVNSAERPRMRREVGASSVGRILTTASAAHGIETTLGRPAHAKTGGEVGHYKVWLMRAFVFYLASDASPSGPGGRGEDSLTIGFLSWLRSHRADFDPDAPVG